MWETNTYSINLKNAGSETNVVQTEKQVQRLDRIIFVLLMTYAGLIFFPVSFGNAVMDVTLLVAGIRLLRQRSDIMVERGLLKAYFLLFFVVALSGLLAQNPRHSLYYIWHYFYYSLPLFLGMWFVRGRRQVDSVIKMLPLSLIFVSVSLIAQGVQGVGRPSTVFGMFVHIFGQFSQLIPFILAITLYDKTFSRSMRMIFVVASALAGIALIFFAYRGAWLALIITLSTLGFLSIRQRPKLVAVLLGMLLLWGGMTVVIVKTLPHEQTVELIMRGSESVHYRTYLWQSAARMIRDYPILGVGVRNFSEQFSTRYVMPDGPEKTIENAHNTLINILAEMGILGLGSYLYLLAYIIRHYWRRLRYKGRSDVLAVAALIATTGMLIQGLSDVNFLYFPVVMQTYFFLLGITWENA